MIELFPPLDFQVYMSKMKITAKKLVVWVSVTALFLLLLLLVTRRSGKGKYDLRPLNIKPGQVVLVTGAAGFIGSQVALTLATRWRAKVVGLDTFSEYYDVQLKMDRASELVQGGVHMYRGSVCDRSLLTLLFDKFNFSGVIHMAAQAGVRNSLKDPLHYLNNNVKCFTTLLELLKTRPHVSLVFASSSTVYGHHSPLPFSPSNTIFSPSNVYAASKISNEHFADVFCSQHGLKIVGLRFFTVYGPWGRPDMAVYAFAENILSGTPLPFYKSSVPVGRDFTFVSDVVQGVLLAFQYTPSRCGEVYNLGFGNTIDLNHLLKLLEQELNATAKIDYQPLPPSDLPATLSDISLSRSVLGYDSTVSVEKGVREFVQWFIKYKALRARGEELQRNRALEAVLARGEKERSGSFMKEVEDRNVRYRRRMESLRGRYREHAEKNKQELPSDLSNKEFTYYPGVDSPGSTIIRGYRGNIEMMKQQCQQTEQCVGFTTNGELKNHLKPRHMWTKSESVGLHVANIDVCAADLHSCGPHQTCQSTGPSSHNCICQEPFTTVGAGCIPKYVEGVVSEMENTLLLSDFIDGVMDWREAKRADFVFFQGVDSPGGDYVAVIGSPDVKKLVDICRNTHHCLGFNTNGLLKHTLRLPEYWTRWTDNPNSGLYVLDVDYCGFRPEKCPPHSNCHKFSAGNYTCRCDSPWTMGSAHMCEMPQGRDTLPHQMVRALAGGEKYNSQNSDLSSIHVILSTDHTHLPGVLALISSIIANTASSKRLKLHMVLADISEEAFTQYLHCFPSFPRHMIHNIVQLDPHLLTGRIHVQASVQTAGNLSSLANFARFFFHELFPTVRKALYLDVDTIVQGDIAELWSQLESSDQLMMAAPRDVKYSMFLSPQVQNLFKQRYGVTLDMNEVAFNAGVYGVNLDLWREKNIHKEVLYWLDQQGGHKLWSLGTQPVLLLVAYRQWSHMDPLWNIDGLGWKKIDESKLTDAKLLHWTGNGKPWMKGGHYKELWSLYVPTACSGSGTCAADGSGYRCTCQHNFNGEHCQFLNQQ